MTPDTTKAAAEMQKLLEEVQWSGRRERLVSEDASETFAYCPYCLIDELFGHESECPWPAIISYIRTLEKEHAAMKEAHEYICTVIDWHPSFNVMGEDSTEQFEKNKPLADVAEISSKVLSPLTL